MNAQTAPLLIQEHWAKAPLGRIHAKRWSHAEDAQGVRVPIVLLHDSLGCVELWRDFPEALARATGRSVIAYDRLGFGRSDPHPSRLQRDFVQTEAHEAFAAVCEEIQIDAFVAFGHSVGGGMALVCAGAQASRCRALITESAQAFVEDRTLDGLRAAQHRFAQEGLDRLRKYHGDKAAWVLSAWIDTWLAPEFASWSLDAHLRRVTCPVLAIHGELDEFGSVRHPERIAARVAGPARVEILTQCGHVPHREQRESVLATVRRWLEISVAD